LADIVDYIRKDNPAAAPPRGPNHFPGHGLRKVPSRGRIGLAENTHELVFSPWRGTPHPDAPRVVRYNVSQGGRIMATTMVHVRVDEKTKQRAAKALAGMGISVSDAVRMLLVRVAAEKALPFDVKVPNATTVKAMRAADKGKGKRLNSAGALFQDLGI